MRVINISVEVNHAATVSVVPQSTGSSIFLSGLDEFNWKMFSVE